MKENSPPIISIIGRSGAGKTTFLTKLVAELKERGLRVAVIKHHSDEGIEIDRPGKDTWRHFQAGADTVVMATPDRIAIFGRLPRDLSPDEAVDLLPVRVDVALTEGYKRAGKLAIEVVRAAHSQTLVGVPHQLIALVTDGDLGLDLPQYQLDDAVGVADFLQHRFNLRPAAEDTQPPREH